MGLIDVRGLINDAIDNADEDTIYYYTSEQVGGDSQFYVTITRSHIHGYDMREEPSGYDLNTMIYEIASGVIRNCTVRCDRSPSNMWYILPRPWFMCLRDAMQVVNDGLNQRGTTDSSLQQRGATGRSRLFRVFSGVNEHAGLIFLSVVREDEDYDELSDQMEDFDVELYPHGNELMDYPLVRYLGHQAYAHECCLLTSFNVSSNNPVTDAINSPVTDADGYYSDGDRYNREGGYTREEMEDVEDVDEDDDSYSDS